MGICDNNRMCYLLASDAEALTMSAGCGGGMYLNEIPYSRNKNIRKKPLFDNQYLTLSVNSFYPFSRFKLLLVH